MAKNDLNEAVHEYLDMIDAANSSSAEMEAALQKLRDLSTYEPFSEPARDPYAEKS